MKRLTEEIWKGKYTYAGKDKSTKEYDLWVDEAIQKLGKLEDLEEEIGCPLEVLGKALIQNCFYVAQWNEYRETDIGFIPEEQIFVISIDEWENGNTLLLSDYKKTWWLKESKSE